MKTTLFLAGAVLAGCSGDNGSDSLSTTYSDLVSTSERSPNGDIHTTVTHVSDDAEFATLDWSEAGRTLSYQPAGAPSLTFVADATLTTPTLDAENRMAVALVNDLPSATDSVDGRADARADHARDPAPVCQVEQPGTDWCQYCCTIPNTQGQGRACTTCG